MPYAATQRSAPPLMETANSHDAPAANPIGSTPVVANIAPPVHFSLASTKSSQSPKSEGSKPHLHGASLARAVKQPQGKAGQSAADDATAFAEEIDHRHHRLPHP